MQSLRALPMPICLVVCVTWAPAAITQEAPANAPAAIAQEAPADGPPAQDTPPDVELTLGGRLQLDFSLPLTERPFEGRFGELSTDHEVRRGRLHVQGTLYQRVDYKLEIDFAGGDVEAKDLYVSLNGLPVGNRFGHFKEPFGLEQLTSSRYLTFMERALTDTLVPSRNTGLRVDSGFADGRGTWAVGAFLDSDGFEATEGDNFNFTGRATYAPIGHQDARHLIHLGVSATHKQIEGSFRASARPGDHLSPTVLAVSIPADGADVLALEAAVGIGSASVQGEYTSASVRSLDGADPGLHGYYVQASWFLTGEARPYDDGAFGRVRPASSFPGGSGAWEIGARYSRLDLGEALVAADATGEVSNLTLGVNWYWSPNVRWMLNYESADVSGLPGDSASSLHARLAIDF